MDDEQVAELVKTDDGESIKDDALIKLLELDASRVTELKGKGGDTKEAFDNGYKKGQKESLTKFEEDAKKHYELTTDVKGLELIGEIVKVKTEALENKEVTPDEIKKTPTYQNALTQQKTDFENKIKELTGEHQKVIEGYQRKESIQGVIKVADSIIDELNPVWSKDPVRAANQRKKIHEGIANGNFKQNPDGMPIVLDKDGNALEDKHGNPIPFKSFVTNEVTSIMDLHESKKRDSAGKPDGDGGGGKPNEDWNWDGRKPQDDKEYMDLVKNATSTEEKVAIRNAYRGKD